MSVLLRSLLTTKPMFSLFDGHDRLFKQALHPDAVYAEYGSGASTIWAAKNVGCTIYSVDSAQAWIDKVESDCNGFPGLHTHVADLGPIGAWGRPISYEKAENFSDYTDWVWHQGQTPTVVLIDGRFRVCCFLTSLFYAQPGTQILFDDYSNRPIYHYIERFLQPSAFDGRQALFIVPPKDRLNSAALQDAIHQFRFVFD